MKNIAIFLLIAASVGCKKNETVEAECVEVAQPDKRACIMIYAPVCGCNNKTYGNSCVAESYGIGKYTLGECGK